MLVVSEMSGSESPAPTFLRAPPPPPRIRPESPANDVVEISDVEDGSDISSVSDFNDEVRISFRLCFCLLYIRIGFHFCFLLPLC